MPHLRIQIPARDEVATLEAVTRGCVAAAEQVCGPQDRLSLLIIDDGSTDGTAEVAHRLSLTDDRVRVLPIEGGRGLGAAFREGVNDALESGADYVVNIDGDGQFDPRQMPLLLSPVKQGECDLALGSRFIDRGRARRMPWTKKGGNIALSALLSVLCRTRFYDVSCGFRCFSRKLLEALFLKGDFTYTLESVLQATALGFRVGEYAISAGPRRHGHSKVAASLGVYAKEALKTIATARRGLPRNQKGKRDREGGPYTFDGKRVLMVSSSYPFHRRDYHALFVHEMAARMAAAGAMITVLTPGTPEGGCEPERWDGVDIRRFAYLGVTSPYSLNGRDGMLENIRKRPASALLLPFFFASMVAHVQREARRLRPDLMITHWLVPGGLASTLAAPGIETLHFAHSSDVHLLARIPGGRWLTRSLGRRGKIIATSVFLEEKIRRLCPTADTATVELGVVEPVTCRDGVTPRSGGSGTGRIRLCSMGRFVPGKGLARIIEALQWLPDCELEIRGSGSYGSTLRDLARGCRGRVRILPPVVGREKRAFWASNDVFLCASDVDEGGFQDNLPVTVLEALSWGLPVVATPFGAMKDLARQTDAIVLAQQTPQSIAAAVNGLIDRDKLEALKRQAMTLGNAYSWDRHVQRLAQAISSDGR